MNYGDKKESIKRYNYEKLPSEITKMKLTSEKENKNMIQDERNLSTIRATNEDVAHNF